MNSHEHTHEHGPSTRRVALLTRRRFLGRSALGVGLSVATIPAVDSLVVSLTSPAAVAHASTPTVGDPGPPVPPFAAVPPIAQGPATPSKGYLVEQLGRGLYWIIDGSYQMVFLVSNEGVIVVDAPPTLGNNILRAIREVTDQPITHVVYSHAHADHIGAAVLYPASAVRIAHQETARLLEEVNDPNRPLPTQVFQDHFTLHVGDQMLELDYRGPNHQPGNLFIYAPQQRVLMLVDVIFPGWVPFKELGESTNIPSWIQAHDQALAYPFQTYIGGHLTRLGNRQDVLLQQAYVEDLKANTQAALAGFDPTPIFQQYGTQNPWVVFKVYLDNVAQMAAEATLVKWRGQLGGVDVFTFDNAAKMTDSVRVDFGFLGPFGIRP